MRAIRGLVVLTASAAIVLAAHAGEEKTNEPGMGPETVVVSKGDAVSAGSFDGTWMYVNRDGRWAMWIRTHQGVPQVKLQYQSLANPEAFETDWDGKALYYLAGSPVTFELKVGKADAKEIQGTWSWILKLEDSSRTESADVALYRTQFGRSLTMDFQNFTRVVSRRGRDSVMKPHFNWTWNKISKRELLWDELPF